MNDSSIVAEETSVIARFEVRRRAYLAPDGTTRGVMPAWAADATALVPLYRAMVLTRAFDLKAVSLQRTGRLGTYAVSLGQEAVAVGVANAMRAEDVPLPSYRDNGARNLARAVGFEPTIPGLESGALGLAKLRPYREHFPENACPGTRIKSGASFDPGWAPVFRRKCDQIRRTGPWGRN